MTTMARHALLPILAALALTAPPRAADSPATDPGTRVIEITARRFQFTPNVITLRKGEVVVLRLHSEDVLHGFFQKPLGIDTVIEPGKRTDVVLTPHETGRYVVICHHFCGSGHGGMKLTLVVE
jgi:cytochrome c oxidase subunit 2